MPGAVFSVSDDAFWVAKLSGNEFLAVDLPASCGAAIRCGKPENREADRTDGDQNGHAASRGSGRAGTESGQGRSLGQCAAKYAAALTALSVVQSLPSIKRLKNLWSLHTAAPSAAKLTLPEDDSAVASVARFRAVNIPGR